MSDLVGKPEDLFSGVMAQIMILSQKSLRSESKYLNLVVHLIQSEFDHIQPPGPSGSKLTTLNVNDSLKFQA